MNEWGYRSLVIHVPIVRNGWWIQAEHLWVVEWHPQWAAYCWMTTERELKKGGVCGVLLAEWLTSIWMETTSSRVYMVGLDDRSYDALETRGGHQVFMDVLLPLV